MSRRHVCRLTAAAALVAAATVAAPPAHAAGVRIYPLGDSITYGATYTATVPPTVPATPPQVPRRHQQDTPGGYRGPLHALLTASGLTHQFVGSVTTNSNALLDQDGQNHHDGHSGYRIDQDATNLDGRTFTSGDAGGHWLTGTATRAPITPDVTVIHLGTNDLVQRYDPGTTYAAPGGKANLADAAQRATFVAHMTDRLAALVDKVQALRPGSRIVLSNILPIATLPNDTTGMDATAYEYGLSVAALAARERAAGERVVFADVWSRFAASTPAGIVDVPTLLSPDTAHPTPSGYAVMAAVYRDAIVAALALP